MQNFSITVIIGYTAMFKMNRRQFLLSSAVTFGAAIAHAQVKAQNSRTP